MYVFLTLTSLLTLVTVLAVAVRLRNSLRNVRGDIQRVRKEIRAIRSENKQLVKAASSLAKESVNATGITALGFRFPVFMGGWSIDTHFGRYLIQHLLEYRPKCILELGSGSSTIIVARTLQLLGSSNETSHLAVDHEERYLEITREVSRLNGVQKEVEFLHCPLEKFASVDKLWYGGLIERLADRKVDFLIVDGPPGPLQPLSRYPALPLLAPHLAEHCTILLDDAGRDDEREIARLWVSENPGFELTFSREGHGLAILRR
jgi:predicted O-methyltransferase YrrM